MTKITDEIIAQNKVERFVSRFEDSYFLLACHVALPGSASVKCGISN